MNENFNAIENEENLQKEKLIMKGKKILKKYKNEIFIVSGILLLTNGLTGKIVGEILYNKGISDGTESVMNNASMLGKGLREFRKAK